ncbi:Arylesterase [Cooperia oncophora]
MAHTTTKLTGADIEYKPFRNSLPSGDGAAGLEIVTEVGLVFITTGLARAYGNLTLRPGLAVLQLEKEMAKHEAKPIRIEGEKFDEEEFIPLGLSSYYSKGRISLYVVNTHPNRQCVEIFTYHKEKNVLFHRKSVCDPRFSSISDIVVVGADRFFITNLAYMSRGHLQTAELAMQESRLSSPSALAIDRRRQLIFVGSIFNENIPRIQVGKRLLAHVPDPDLVALLPGRNACDIWIALHPVLHQVFLVTLNPSDERIRSPSQVLRVRMQEDGVSWVITEPYANDGATISASNAVVYEKDTW